MSGQWLPTALELSGTSVILAVGYAFRRMMARLDQAMSARWSAIDGKLNELKERFMADGSLLREQVREMQRDQRELDRRARESHEQTQTRLGRLERRMDTHDALKGVPTQ